MFEGSVARSSVTRGFSCRGTYKKCFVQKIFFVNIKLA